MLCPNCGKSNPDDKDFCELCGAALVGPKSMILNEPNPENKIDKDNISSITGIDLSKINQSTSAFNDFNISLADTNGNTGKKKKDPKIKIDFKFILLIILLAIIIVLSIYVMKVGKKTCPVSSSSGGYRVTTSNFVFTMPTDYEYSEHSINGNLILRNGDVELVFYPLANGVIDNVQIDSLKAKYTSYADARFNETTLKDRKAYIVDYAVNDYFYIDFYYQFSDGKILYGQGKSQDKNKVNSEEVKNIIGSFNQRPVSNKFSYNGSGSNQGSIVSSFN